MKFPINSDLKRNRTTIAATNTLHVPLTAEVTAADILAAARVRTTARMAVTARRAAATIFHLRKVTALIKKATQTHI